MRIAILGAGALGLVLGGLLTERGRDVVLIARDRTVAALNAHGAILTGAVEKTIPVRASRPEALTGIFDTVLVLTKRAATRTALAPILPHLHGESLVCTLQNGVPEDEVAALVGEGRTVGGVVLVSAERLAPNRSRITSAPEILRDHAFEIGELDGRTTPRLAALQAVLADVGGCRIVDNLLDIRWAKLLVNATLGAMTAALGCVCRKILEDATAMRVVARLADETVRTARACGHHPARLQDMDLEALTLGPGETGEEKAPIFRRYFAPYADTTSSMQQDLENGRPTEVEAINGYIRDKAAAHGLAAPANALIVRLVKEAESHGTVPRFAENLARMRQALSL